MGCLCAGPAQLLLCGWEFSACRRVPENLALQVWVSGFSSQTEEALAWNLSVLQLFCVADNWTWACAEALVSVGQGASRVEMAGSAALSEAQCLTGLCTAGVAS